MTSRFDPSLPQARRSRSGPVLIYAPGGGWGHTRRALTLARAFASSRILSHVDPGFSRPPGTELQVIPGDWDVSSVRRALRDSPCDTLLVDTFPAGLAGELDDATLAAFEETILVTRWVDRAAYEVVAEYDVSCARYDQRWAPYPADACEWEEEIASDVHLGWVVRDLGAPEPGQGVALLGAAPPWVRRTLGDAALVLDGPLERLPPARAYLSWGAGYNTAYEWEVAIGGHAPWAMIPLERRYDDQFGRALRLGRAVTNPRALERWLSHL